MHGVNILDGPIELSVERLTEPCSAREVESTCNKPQKIRAGPRKRRRKKPCIGSGTESTSVPSDGRLDNDLDIDDYSRPSYNDWNEWLRTITERSNNKSQIFDPLATNIPSYYQQPLAEEDVDWWINGTDHIDNAERKDREKWGKWAAEAAEIERHRRIEANIQLDREEAMERTKRREWALNAIETERNDRISSQFLNALTSTNWFNETISTYSDDYELVRSIFSTFSFFLFFLVIPFLYFLSDLCVYTQMFRSSTYIGLSLLQIRLSCKLPSILSGRAS